MQINEEVFALLNSGEGFTCSLSGERPTSGYAVCIYPETAVPISSEIDLRDFVTKNAKLLMLPGRNLGAWCVERGGANVLMVSVIVGDALNAIYLARRHRQTHVYSIHGKEEIKVAGIERWRENVP